MLHFIYALFHSPTYRRRFANELAVDFPRVLIPREFALFQKLSRLGQRLAAAHLLKQDNAEPPPRYQGDAQPIVEVLKLRACGFIEKPGTRRVSEGKTANASPLANASGSQKAQLQNVEAGYPKYRTQRVYLNANAWLEPIEQAAWDFRIGAHRVFRKWLKDRRGRSLGSDHLANYAACAEAVATTIDVANGIDASINAHGGWPAAFLTAPAHGQAALT